LFLVTNPYPPQFLPSDEELTTFSKTLIPKQFLQSDEELTTFSKTLIPKSWIFEIFPPWKKLNTKSKWKIQCIHHGTHTWNWSQQMSTYTMIVFQLAANPLFSTTKGNSQFYWINNINWCVWKRLKRFICKLRFF